MTDKITRCGFIAIIGKPNVGKSTLLNQLVGHKVSATSRKPNTTRDRIMGIHTKGPLQAIYIDTPGWYSTNSSAYNPLMNCIVSTSINDVELIIFVSSGTNWTSEDEKILNTLRKVCCPIILAINKIDIVIEKQKLLPHISFLHQKMIFQEIIPICAKNGMNTNIVYNIVRKTLPVSKHYFSKNCITNHSNYFMISEIIREKLMRFLGDEVPYCVDIKIDDFFITKNSVHNINATIVATRNSHKKIIVGSRGEKIKIISVKARQEMEKFFKSCVYLKLWVKAKVKQPNNPM